MAHYFGNLNGSQLMLLLKVTLLNDVFSLILLQGWTIPRERMFVMRFFLTQRRQNMTFSLPILNIITLILVYFLILI